MNKVEVANDSECEEIGRSYKWMHGFRWEKSHGIVSRGPGGESGLPISRASVQVDKEGVSCDATT